MKNAAVATTTTTTTSAAANMTHPEKIYCKNVPWVQPCHCIQKWQASLILLRVPLLCWGHIFAGCGGMHASVNTKFMLAVAFRPPQPPMPDRFQAKYQCQTKRETMVLKVWGWGLRLITPYLYKKLPNWKSSNYVSQQTGGSKLKHSRP